MTIAQPLPLVEDIKNLPNQATLLVFWEKEPQQTIEIINELPPKDSIHFFIGPEGGFSPQEIATFHQANIPTLSMGSLTLRAETAVLCAATLVLFKSNRLTPPPRQNKE